MFDFYMRLQDAYKYRKSPWGPYRVSIERLNTSFLMYLPPHHKSPSQDKNIRGEYETEVVDLLADEASPTTTFWEVGGGWGYFSLALADQVQRVTAFEADFGRAQLIRKSSQRNQYSHFEVIQEKVGESNPLDDYQEPDLVLMDIEGWEYAALNSSPQLIEHSPTFVIELHDTEQLYMNEPDVKPNETVELLEEHGYSVEKISERSSGNYHILAKL
jgi:precorrin-6B methylase 2